MTDVTTPVALTDDEKKAKIKKIIIIAVVALATAFLVWKFFIKK